jgi:hypothetical protein
MRRRQIQRKASRAEANPNVRIPEGSGAKLPAGVAADMGEKLGADFSDVRVHTGGDSEEAAEKLGAKAFTVDKNVHFARGKWAPDSKEGQHLLAHELTHVVQGEKSAVRQKNEVSQPHDPAEVEADQAADAAMSGGKASIGAAQGARVHLNKDGDKAPAGAPEKHDDHDGKKPDEKKAAESAAPGAEKGAEGGDKKVEGGDKKAESGDKKDEEKKGDGGGGGYGDITSLAKSINAGNVAAWKADKEILWKILLGPFEANWFKAKDCLLMDQWPVEAKPDHALCIDLMRGLVEMRAEKCGQIQKFVEQNIVKKVMAESAGAKGADPLAKDGVAGEMKADAEKGNEPTPDGKGGKKKPANVSFEAPKGNDKPSSDVDIATKGLNTELAVAMFNEEFKKQLKVSYESGTVFDYNVYGADWIHNLQFDKKDQGGKEVTKKITPGVEHNEGKKEERDPILEQASMLHMRRYMTQAEWETYSDGRLKKVDDAEDYVKLDQVLKAVDSQFKQFEALITEKSVSVGKSIEDAETGHTSAWEAHKAKHFKDDAIRTRASNRIYEEKLRELKAVRAQYKILEAAKPKEQRTDDDRAKMAELARSATDVLSQALYFANEVYATEGAVLHTVLGIQEADKIGKEQGEKPQVPLSREQYLQSFNENAGDVLKDLTHFKDNPPFAYFRSGKYMDRMLKAATQLAPESTKHELFPKFSEISAKAVAAKGDDVKGDDPLLCANEFKEIKAGDVAALRGEVTKFAADIPALGEKHQAQAAKVEGGEPPGGGPEKKEDKAASTDVVATNPELAKAGAATKGLEELVVQLEKTSQSSDTGKPDKGK